MAKCVKCGKKGLFLKVDENQLCDSCVDERIEAVKTEARKSLDVFWAITKNAETIRSIVEKSNLKESATETLTKVFEELNTILPAAMELNNSGKKEFDNPNFNYERTEAVVRTSLQKMNELHNQSQRLLNRVITLKSTLEDPKKEIVVPTSLGGIPLAYHYDSVKLYTVPGQEPDFASLEPGMSVKFVIEPQNNYDPNAIYAESGGIKLGYLYRGKLQDMTNDFIRQGNPITSHITLINDDEGKIEVFMGFYRNQETSVTYELSLDINKIIGDAPKKRRTNSYKLTGNTNEEMQENIGCCSEDDEVEIEYDYDKDKYLVTNIGDEIGYLPKSADGLVDDLSEGTIEEISTNDSGKYVVRVKIYNEDW